ncbi:uncharacterized protein [Dysidea avara]|uniref:uncharacterized protein n=1 Tax=Dysidea avara TaxID=196820 RepID=UPI00331FFEA8
MDPRTDSNYMGIYYHCNGSFSQTSISTTGESTSEVSSESGKVQVESNNGSPMPILSDEEDDCETVDTCYSVKLINPNRKSEYRVEKWRTHVKFKTPEQLTMKLKESYIELSACDEVQVGYMEPGHGYKGKQRWITCCEDLQDMYEAYSTKKEILWCFLPGKGGAVSKKRSNDTAGHADEKRTKCTTEIEGKIDEAKEILLKLKDKHGKKYTAEQYHAWAQLIQIGKQSSYDEPPDYPFFRGKKKKDNERVSESTSSNSVLTNSTTNATSVPTVVGISPGKRINLRTECIQQLQQLGELLDKGNITSDQYEKLQETILSDIYKF